MSKKPNRRPSASPKLLAAIASRDATLAGNARTIADLEARCAELKEASERNYRTGQEWRERSNKMEKDNNELGIRNMAGRGEIEQLRTSRDRCLGWINAKLDKNPLDEGIPF